MRTVGQILKEDREAKFYTLEEVENATKIRKELLQALEAGDYAKLPPATFIQGFIKNYSRFLNLDSKKLLAIFRGEFYESQADHVMEAFSNPNTNKFKVTPSRAIGLVISLLIISFFVYLWFQYRQFSGTPRLDVISPQDQAVVENPSVIVQGKADPEIKVLVNNQAIPVSDKGEFKEDIKLTAPVNKITVIAVGKFGQKSKVERTVYVKR